MTDAGKTFCGLFAIIGLPNAGKSTLLNALVDFKLAPVHPKPQMTRKNLLGIVTLADTQWIFIDTPGYHERDELLNRRMQAEIHKATKEADALVFLWGRDQTQLQTLRAWCVKFAARQNVILVLNKSDLKDRDTSAIEALAKEFHLPLLHLSAKTKEGLDALLKALKPYCLPQPFFYPDDDLSTASCRDIAKSILQESLMDVLGEELPYQAAVVIESYQEGVESSTIAATIVVNRASQKGMVIGKGGRTLKSIGQRTRAILEKTFAQKIRLDLFVKVDPNWIANPQKVDDYA